MSDTGKIVKHHSLKHADLILTELRKIWPKNWEGWLRVWSNGREQGYHLTATIWNPKRGERAEAACVFAEGRSCDGALVVIGDRDRFASFGNPMPDDDLWDDPKARQYFYDTTDLHESDGGPKQWNKTLRGRGNRLAARWIVKRFRALLARDLKTFRERQAVQAKLAARVG